MRIALAVWLLLIAPDVGAAQDDEVLLTNGGRVRGRVIEHDPDATTTVVLATGETRTLEASAVASVRYAGDAAAMEPQSETPTAASELAAPPEESSAPAPREEPSACDGCAIRLRGGGWLLGGTFAGRWEWQGTFFGGGGLEIAFPSRIQLRVEGIFGWEGAAGSSAVPGLDAARLGLRLGLGVSATEWLELRTFGGVGFWLGPGEDEITVAGNWEVGERVVVHLPPGDHLEVGLELTWHGTMTGTANPFGVGLFVGFVI